MSASTAWRRTLRFAAILFLLAAAPAGAQQQFTLNFRDTDLRQVIETVGELTGRNFLPDPRVRGTVTLISNTPMSLDAVYEAFLTMLSINGFVTVDDGEFTRIVADQTARQLPSPAEATEREALVTQVVRVDNVGATTLVPILRPMQAQYAHLTAIPNSNLLVIVDRKANVDRLIEVIDAVDREMVEDVEVIRLNHAFAGEVVQTLSAVAQASAAAAGGAPGVQIVADDRTNSVLLSGT
ncbi:MAG TPA: secretin N-terminal domain-containing protein [Microbacterium sp.]|nr:secretin N-terminal domain-containing protein [Microbacterium sp.]